MTALCRSDCCGTFRFAAFLIRLRLNPVAFRIRLCGGRAKSRLSVFRRCVYQAAVFIGICINPAAICISLLLFLRFLFLCFPLPG